MKPILFLLIVLSAGLAGAAPEKELADYEEMSPGHCAESPPGELYARLWAMKPHLPGVSSAGGQDLFYSVYQQQLRKFVDARYPRASQYRQPLTEAYDLLVQYLEEIYHHDMIKHLRERTPAEVEWVICQAEKGDYKLWRETGYDASAIERLALIMADGSGRDPKFEQRALPLLHGAIRQFVAATTDQAGEVNRKRGAFLAHALIKFLTDLI